MSSTPVHPLSYSTDLIRMNPIARWARRNKYKIVLLLALLIAASTLWIAGMTFLVRRVDDFQNQKSKNVYSFGVGNICCLEWSLGTQFNDNPNNLWQGQSTITSRWNFGAVDRRFGVPIKCMSGLRNLGSTDELLQKYMNQKMFDQPIQLRRQVFTNTRIKSMKTLHSIIYNQAELNILYATADEEIEAALH